MKDQKSWDAQTPILLSFARKEELQENSFPDFWQLLKNKVQIEVSGFGTAALVAKRRGLSGHFRLKTQGKLR